MTARVRGLRAAATSSTVGVRVRLSTSQKTGRAPRAATALPAPTKLTVGSTTSVSGPTPASSIEMNSASVQQLTEVTLLAATSRCSAKAASNAVVRGPLQTHELSNTSATAASSCAPSVGCKTFIIALLLQ